MRGCLFPTLSAMPTRSFSILELVMMLAIVGVLSAVAVPRIVSAGQHARSHRLMEDLQVLQRAADLYEAEHVVSLGRRSSGGNANAALVIARLVGRTDTEGNVDPVGEYGPYLIGLASERSHPRHSARGPRHGRWSDLLRLAVLQGYREVLSECRGRFANECWASRRFWDRCRRRFGRGGSRRFDFDHRRAGGSPVKGPQTEFFILEGYMCHGQRPIAIIEFDDSSHTTAPRSEPATSSSTRRTRPRRCRSSM